MKSGALKPLLLAVIAVVTACGPKQKDEAGPAAAGKGEGVLLKVGSITVDQADLDYQIKENYGGRSDEQTRRKALDELASRAQFAQAAIDEDLLDDPLVRAEIARILANRLKERDLYPELKAAAATPVPEARLRELYAADESRFRSNEKRQVAVLWLKPGGDPKREQQYMDKLASAREWFFNNDDLKAHPEQGFSTLGVDYSEHQASRYKGGVLGWMESGGGMDAWTKAVAEIAFSLNEPGEVSAVITKPEGVFLVRYMTAKPAFLRPFEEVSNELEQVERKQIRTTLETQFNDAIGKKHPVNDFSGASLSIVPTALSHSHTQPLKK